MNLVGHFCIGIITLGLCIATSLAQTTYTVTEIGTLGGPVSLAFGLNNSGTVVGISSTANDPDVLRAFRWINGSIIDIGTLGGPSAQAFGVNDAGQITGQAETKDSIPFNETFHAFRWQNGTMLDLGTTGGQSSRGMAVNAAGLVVGASQVCIADPKHPGGPCIPVGNEFAFFWNGNSSDDLGGLLGSSDSSALGINASNQVVGQSITVNGFTQPRHAVLWQNGQPLDLGTLGGANSFAFDVNDAGLVAGFSDDASNTSQHPFIYDIRTGQMTDMGLPPDFTSAQAVAINGSGQMVGVASNCCQTAAFVFDGAAMHDLNTLIPKGSGWNLSEATDINDAGWIIGHGTHNGADRSFLLKPVIKGCGPDIDCSGTVNVADLLAVINSWGASGGGGPADINHDNVVNAADLLAVINAWGPHP